MIMSSIPGRAQRGACPTGGDGRGWESNPPFWGTQTQGHRDTRCGFPEVLG